MKTTRAPLARPHQRTVQTVDEVVTYFLPLIPGSRVGPCVVLIGGCSRTGKSWLATQLCKRLTALGASCRRVGLDAWLIGVDERPPSSAVLDRFDCPAIVKAVEKLVHGKPVYPPVYDPITRRRLAQQAEEPIQVSTGFLLVDGVIALALPELRTLSNLSIFVAAPDAVRLPRLQTFYRVIKGLGSEADRIISQRESEEVPFILQTVRCANLIFNGGTAL